MAATITDNVTKSKPNNSGIGLPKLGSSPVTSRSCTKIRRTQLIHCNFHNKQISWSSFHKRIYWIEKYFNYKIPTFFNFFKGLQLLLKAIGLHSQSWAHIKHSTVLGVKELLNESSTQPTMLNANSEATIVIEWLAYHVPWFQVCEM